MKIKILVLKDCKYCKELEKKIEEIREDLERKSVSTVYMDADIYSSVADYVENLLDTLTYPIVVIENNLNTYYIYRVDKHTQLGVKSIGQYDYKIGCLTVSTMFDEIKKLVN